MKVITRFAPSPTGFLHIGGARTALFNWYYAHHHKGKFLLRIEDTDRARSTQEAVEAIFSSLQWLGINWDEEPIFQFSRAKRHAEVAHALLEKGHAYRCYCTVEEVEAMREEARKKGLPPRYNGYWRDRNVATAPQNAPFVIRLKAPTQGETIIQDAVQGTVKINNQELDDMVLLRSDGTPTYMLSVVVDDHDMEITNIIRGDDHLTNAFRQYHIYEAMGWPVPVFAHIPLIHGSDGAKLSKRHGAIGTEAYKAMGILPEALCNYLLRLGWAHGDDEIFTPEQAIEWFDLPEIGRSPSRLDINKLLHLNAHYLREADNERLLKEIETLQDTPLSIQAKERLRQGMNGLKARARTLVELKENAYFYIATRPLSFNEEAKNLLLKQPKEIFDSLLLTLEQISEWTELSLETSVRQTAENIKLKLGQIAQPLRAALTGSTISPGIFEIMITLGREETLGRIKDAIALLREETTAKE